MRTVNVDGLKELHKNAENIRNICILAHVDHGKTTLADALVASNNIISERMSGKLRYMDSRKDEQERGITMKSSAIALHHHSGAGEQYLINLIDSPGHVDFSSEVSTAVRLCDGAIIVVDVVEGVCPQTKFAIRQAWIENLKPILILNKMDRLIIEKKISPIDAHLHLMQILEQTNAVMGELFATNLYEKATEESNDNRVYKDDKNVDKLNEQFYDWDVGLDESDDSSIYFSPEQGNVIFASALDRWGFSLSHFAELYAKKLLINKKLLMKTLWGDYYVNMKAKKIVKGAQAKAKKPLFVQFILENIWKVYETFLERKDKEGMDKMCKTLNVSVQSRDIRHSDPRVYLQSMCSQWLPLGPSILEMVCEILPNPKQISEERVEKLMCGKAQTFVSLPEQTKKLKQDFLDCCPSDESPIIVFVSKLFPFESSMLPQKKYRVLTAEEMARRRTEARARHLLKQQMNDNGESPTSENCTEVATADADKTEEQPSDHVLIAFARVYSGTIKKGQRLYVLGPKHDTSVALKQDLKISTTKTLKDLQSDEHITSFVVEDLYLLMGRELECLDQIGAGNVCGIGGLQEHILKTATISNTIACQPFLPVNIESKAIVRVAVESKLSGNMDALIKGLRLLNQADACVEVYVQETGEHVLVTSGEVHLQRCIDDLRNSYAKVDLNVSAPIVPFRETIIDPPKVDMVNEIIEDKNQMFKSTSSGSNSKNQVVDRKSSVEMFTPNKKCRLKLKAKPLPDRVTRLLDENAEILKILDQWCRTLVKSSDKTGSNCELNQQTVNSLRQFKTRLSKAFDDSGAEWADAMDCIWSFGPRRCGPNVLLNRSSYKHLSVWGDAQSFCEFNERNAGVDNIDDGSSVENACDRLDPRSAYNSSFISGFQIATLAGPLCEEPMMGVCFIVEDWNVETYELSDETMSPFGPLSGQIMAVVKDCCRQAFQVQPQRLMAAMYSCHIQATAEVVGRMFGVLSKRGGRILHGDMQEGSAMFNVTALLPVIESFNFTGEIRKQTSGLANPQLFFSHWEVIETDPFWVPSTAEEYLHFGDKADSENRTANYMIGVRKRKGLPVAEKIVEHAEKQRTLTRNK